MATYKEISGTNIEVVSSDPANPVVGQVWYNTTTGTVKGASVSTVGSWSTGGSLNTPRTQVSGAGTSNTSALAFGGEAPGSPPTAVTESYNGSSWTEVNDLNSAKQLAAGTGTQTSALSIGGIVPGGVKISK